MTNLTKQQKREIADKLENTSGVKDEEVCKQYDVELADLEILLLNEGIERCKSCEWWIDCCDLGENNICLGCKE